MPLINERHFPQTIDQSLVADLARAMLDRAATVEPGQVAAERRAFAVLRDAYFADPPRALAGGDTGSGQLTFGLPGVEELLTPVLLAASAEVVAYLGARGADATRRGVRRLLRLPIPEIEGGPSAAADVGAGAGTGADAAGAGTGADAAGAAVPELSREQWADVRRILTDALVRHARMSPQRAALIAAAVVGDGITGDRPE
jgi:hypothetical protein